MVTTALNREPQPVLGRQRTLGASLPAGLVTRSPGPYTSLLDSTVVLRWRTIGGLAVE